MSLIMATLAGPAMQWVLGPSRRLFWCRGGERDGRGRKGRRNCARGEGRGLPAAGFKSKVKEKTEIATAEPSELETHSSSSPKPAPVVKCKVQPVKPANGNILLQLRLKRYH